MYYYRSRICRAFGRALGPILEVGGGYGGLAIELLRHVETPTYFLVELPDALPVAYFYLRASSDYPVQVIYRPEDRVDPSSRIVLLAPWKLSDMNVEIDLLINTMSFQHMDWKNLQFYLAQADRLKAKRMYLVNRNQKRDPTDVIIDDYPIPTRLRIIKDSKWPFGVHRERLYEAGIEGKAS